MGCRGCVSDLVEMQVEHNAILDSCPERGEIQAPLTAINKHLSRDNSSVTRHFYISKESKWPRLTVNRETPDHLEAACHQSSPTSRIARNRRKLGYLEKVSCAQVIIAFLVLGVDRRGIDNESSAERSVCSQGATAFERLGSPFHGQYPHRLSVKDNRTSLWIESPRTRQVHKIASGQFGCCHVCLRGRVNYFGQSNHLLTNTITLKFRR